MDNDDDDNFYKRLAEIVLLKTEPSLPKEEFLKLLQHKVLKTQTITDYLEKTNSNKVIPGKEYLTFNKFKMTLDHGIFLNSKVYNKMKRLNIDFADQMIETVDQNEMINMTDQYEIIRNKMDKFFTKMEKNTLF